MTRADCDRVAGIRVRGRQTAYRGCCPAYLDALDVVKEAEQRRTRFREGAGIVVDLVAEQDGALVGRACHGPYRDGEVRTEDAGLYAIYVDPGRYGAGT